MTAPTVREVQRLESWRALQAAAIDLVGRYGFAEVTVDDIAVAAGVSRRTFFNHFPTKAAALFDPDPETAVWLAELLARTDLSAGLWTTLRRVCLAVATGHEDVLEVRRRLVAEHPELDAYHRDAHWHVEIALEKWISRNLPGDPFAARLAAQGACAVLGAAFASWPPDADPDVFTDLVDRGFDRLVLSEPDRR